MDRGIMVGGLCLLVTIAVSLALYIYGLMLILEKQKSSENDVQVLQRQLKGFGFILLAQAAMVLGLFLCSGAGLLSSERGLRELRRGTERLLNV